MAKKKKSRKIGQIGIPKTNIPRTPSAETTPASPAKLNKHKGNKSGTRQQVAEAADKRVKQSKANPKIGSKTPIDLNAYKAGVAKTPKAVTTETVSYKTPQEELEAIENNQELEALLDKQLSQALSKTESAYVEKLTARYRVLCELMGIDANDDDSPFEESSEQDDPFAQLDAIKLEDFKD